jgi:tRNA N6-adenosine threonylcarbamoyltransferase
VEGPGLGAGDALLILALETSCDETAAALVEDGHIRSNVVSSQADLHARFGGVVPEVASRRHLELVMPVVREALAEADLTLADVETVAVTQGPGLIGALLVGLSAAKALAWGRGLPLAPVNHLHGHVASLYLEPDPLEPPFLCLLASGGHTLLVDVPEHGAFRRLGTTIDDAAGEAFDKGARLLGLGYPGGAEIDRLARDGDPEAFDFPVARVPGLDFSFSGVKTALLYAARDLGDELPERRADLAASYQRAIVRALVQRTQEAAEQTGAERLAVVGGVAANSELRASLPDAKAPPLALCTDNAAMIASAARYVQALSSSWHWSRPRSRSASASPRQRCARSSPRRRPGAASSGAATRPSTSASACSSCCARPRWRSASR